MSNQIQVSFSFIVASGSYQETYMPPASVITQAEVGRGGGIQNIGTTEETINFGDVTANGCLFLKNLDDTNYVTYGPVSGGAMVVAGKLNPGEFAWLRVAPTAVFRAQADTAVVKLDVRMFDD